MSSPSHNLPVETTSFVGREKEVADLQALLSKARLVTLIGSAGMGKTRLTLRLGRNLLDTFPDGVWLVELASVANPLMLPYAIARAFDLPDEAGRSLAEKLAAYLAERQLLLILDNCDYLVDACGPLIATLLSAAPGVKILTSCREPLTIPGEVSYRVPSLSLPAKGQALDESEAVRLFVERAQTITPGFGSAQEQMEAVAHICRRLDGIPLAIELAAARVNLLGVGQISSLLDDRFRLATGDGRQETLRTMIDWSWELLSEPERTLLRCVSVFAGGWAQESAEAVCAYWSVNETRVLHPEDIFDLLTQLVYKSLVLVEQNDLGETRYRLLESIRQYASQKLKNTGQLSVIRDHHMAHFHKLAVQAAAEMHTRKQIYWHRRQVVEIDNFRAALEWSMERYVVAGLMIASSLERYWQSHAVQEGLRWLQVLLAKPEKPKEAAARARGWYSLASLQRWTGDMETAYYYAPKSLQLFRQIGDLRGESECLSMMAFAVYHMGKLTEAVELAKRALAISRANNDRLGQQRALAVLGGRVGDRDYARARGYLEEALAICRSMGNLSEASERLDDLAVLSFRSGDYTQAYEFLKEAIDVAKEGQMPNLGWLYRTMGELELKRGNLQSAREYLETSIQMNRNQGALVMLQWGVAHLAYTLKKMGEFSLARDRFVEGLHLFEQAGQARIGIVYMVEGLASLMTIMNRHLDALIMYTWTDVERRALFDARPVAEQTDVDHDLSKIRASLNESDFSDAEAQGKSLTQQQALDMAYQCAKTL